MGFDYNTTHRVRFYKDRVAVDVIFVQAHIAWCDEFVHKDDWSYLSSADPLTHDFFFVKPGDATLFKLTFTS